MLKRFTAWAEEVFARIQQDHMDVKITSSVNYFTKITIDSKRFISEIVYWNNNQFNVEILAVSSEERIYYKDGEMQCDADFSAVFADFFKKLDIKID